MKAFSQAWDIDIFQIQYTKFLETQRSLTGDAGHSDDKRLDITISQAGVFNPLNPDDLGITQWQETSDHDIAKLLGQYVSQFAYF